MSEYTPPRGGLYECIRKIWDDGMAETRTLSGEMALLRKELPQCVAIPQATARAVIESYHLKQQAEEICSYLWPVKI